ncbi:hypothetical protein BH10PLA2_BH10PLA2_38710 [soil metagenome]
MERMEVTRSRVQNLTPDGPVGVLKPCYTIQPDAIRRSDALALLSSDARWD